MPFLMYSSSIRYNNVLVRYGGLMVSVLRSSVLLGLNTRSEILSMTAGIKHVRLGSGSGYRITIPYFLVGMILDGFKDIGYSDLGDTRTYCIGKGDLVSFYNHVKSFYASYGIKVSQFLDLLYSSFRLGDTYLVVKHQSLGDSLVSELDSVGSLDSFDKDSVDFSLLV